MKVWHESVHQATVAMFTRLAIRTLCFAAVYAQGSAPLPNTTLTIAEQVSEDLLPYGKIVDLRWIVYRYTGDLVSLDPEIMLKCHERAMSGCAALRIHCHPEVFSARDVKHTGGRHLWPMLTEDVCKWFPGTGKPAPCFMNSTVSTQPHLEDFVSIDIGMMNSVDRTGVALERTEFIRRAAIIEKAFRALGFKTKVMVLGAQLQPDGIKALAGLGYERYGNYISTVEVLQLQGKNILPFSLQHQTFLLSVLVDTRDEFFSGEQYTRLASITEDYASHAVTIELVCNRFPEAIPLDKEIERAHWFVEKRFAERMMPITVKWISSTPLPGESQKDQFAAIVGDQYMQQQYPEDRSWSPYAVYGLTCIIGLAGVAMWAWKDSRSRRRKAAVPAWEARWKGFAGDSAEELADLQKSDGKVHMDLITQQGIAPLEVEICKRPDGTDWLLGKGGFAKVYKAKDANGQIVAVKVLQNADRSRLHVFAKEAKVMESVNNHPQVVQFHGACLLDNLAMIVLEYMEGGDLHEALMDAKSASPDAGPMNWYRQGANLALDLAKGLVFLHSQKIVHRDIKSKNVLLAKDRSRGKIADVGLSRVLDSLALSSASVPFGTFAYAAPEVLLGYRSTVKVDMYSFGVVLWEMITHQTPMRGQLRDFQIPEECPQSISDLHEACLQQDPQLRPSAADAVLVIQQAIHDHMSKSNVDVGCGQLA